MSEENVESSKNSQEVVNASVSVGSQVPVNEEEGEPGSKRLKSMVWEHFDRVKIADKQYAVCRGCNKRMAGSSKSGTSHLKHRLTSCFKVKNRVDVRQQLIQASLKKDNNIPYVSGKFKFNQDVSRMEMVNMIVLHEYPLSCVDHIGFRRYSASLNPDYKVVSRNTVKADIFKSFHEEKGKLKKFLNSIDGRVAITTDMWSAKNQKKGYMAVTGHFIDDSWKLHHRILRFAYVPAPHTSNALTAVLMDALVDLNLDEKVSTITLDNCTTNDGIIDDLLDEKFNPSKLILGGSILHMRCSAHILNLIIQDGLKVIGSAVEKVRDLVSYWVATPKRYEKFEGAVRYVKIPETKRLTLDSKTRWNSTYEMLEIALLYKDAFYRLRQSLKKEKFVLPDEIEWERAREVCDKLAIFSKVTICFSGQNYPTANLFFQKVCQIRLALRNWEASNSTLIKKMASEMITKFDKYWGKINGTLGVASLLDPRKKMEHVRFYFERLYPGHADFECTRVKRLLDALFSEYEKRYSTMSSEDAFSSSNLDNMSQEFSELDDMEWKRHVSMMPKKKQAKSEVEVYLEDDVMMTDPEKFDILVYWSVVGKQYPILSRVAKDILAIPITSVASESAFSASGRIISPSRSRLLPKTVEALMCLKSWRVMEFQGNNKNDMLACSSVLYDEDVDEEKNNDEDGDDDSEDNEI